MKGKKVLASMTKQYGPEKGKRVFYASINSGKIKGAENYGRGNKRKRLKKILKK